jgi:hypothetical protein
MWHCRVQIVLQITLTLSMQLTATTICNIHGHNFERRNLGKTHCIVLGITNGGKYFHLAFKGSQVDPHLHGLCV